jgi:hypothetical protein
MGALKRWEKTQQGGVTWWCWEILDLFSVPPGKQPVCGGCSASFGRKTRRIPSFCARLHPQPPEISASIFLIRIPSRFLGDSLCTLCLTPNPPFAAIVWPVGRVFVGIYEWARKTGLERTSYDLDCNRTTPDMKVLSLQGRNISSVKFHGLLQLKRIQRRLCTYCQLGRSGGKTSMHKKTQLILVNSHLALFGFLSRLFLTSLVTPISHLIVW